MAGITCVSCPSGAEDAALRGRADETPILPLQLSGRGVGEDLRRFLDWNLRLEEATPSREEATPRAATTAKAPTAAPARGQGKRSRFSKMTE